jgi:hypothetical protein
MSTPTTSPATSTMRTIKVKNATANNFSRSDDGTIVWRIENDAEVECVLTFLPPKEGEKYREEIKFKGSDQYVPIEKTNIVLDWNA